MGLELDAALREGLTSLLGVALMQEEASSCSSGPPPPAISRPCSSWLLSPSWPMLPMP